MVKIMEVTTGLLIIQQIWEAVMYKDEHHPKADIIIEKLENKFDIEVTSMGYLPGPKLYALSMPNLKLYNSRKFKARVKVLGMKYGKNKRWFITCIPKS